jgi:hypothetical protein
MVCFFLCVGVCEPFIHTHTHTNIHTHTHRYEGDDSDSKIKGDVLMSDTVKIEESNDQDHAFKVVDGSKVYTFAADSEEEMYGWLKEMRHCVGMESPRRMSRSASYAAHMQESKSAIMFFEKKGMLGTKSVKRFIVLNKRTLQVHKGQNESSKILHTIVLKEDQFRVRMIRGKTKSTINSIEIGSNDGTSVLIFAAPNTFQQQDWYETLLKILNKWNAASPGIWDEHEEEKKDDTRRPAAPSDVEEEATATTTKNIFRSSLDEDDEDGDDALDEW